MTTPKKQTIDESPAADMAALYKLTVAQLQKRYRDLYGHESRSHNHRWLFKRIAFRMQEVRHGGLSERAKRRAPELAKDSFLRDRPPPGFDPLPGLSEAPQPPPGPEPPELSGPVEAPEPPKAYPRDPRLPPIGTVLKKKHGGELHEITVLAKGFEYQGRTYRSLSGIAKAVTGTDWNGFLWLGLGKRKKKTGDRRPQDGGTNG
jgi:hypothetical protein